MIPRTTMVQTDAVERLTLIEKLKQLSDKYLNQYKYYGNNADLNCSSAVDETINIVKQHSQEICNWRNNKDTDGWYEWSDCGDYSSDCGLEWNMSNDDSPLENDMNFCPKCGRKIVEIQPPSEVQDD